MRCWATELLIDVITIRYATSSEQEARYEESFSSRNVRTSATLIQRLQGCRIGVARGAGGVGATTEREKRSGAEFMG